MKDKSTPRWLPDQRVSNSGPSMGWAGALDCASRYQEPWSCPFSAGPPRHFSGGMTWRGQVLDRPSAVLKLCADGQRLSPLNRILEGCNVTVALCLSPLNRILEGCNVTVALCLSPLNRILEGCNVTVALCLSPSNRILEGCNVTVALCLSPSNRILEGCNVTVALCVSPSNRILEGCNVTVALCVSPSNRILEGCNVTVALCLSPGQSETRPNLAERNAIFTAMLQVEALDGRSDNRTCIGGSARADLRH